MKTVLQTELGQAKIALTNAKFKVAELRSQVKVERAVNKAAKVQAVKAKKAVAAQKRDQAIQKAQARLAKMHEKLDALRNKAATPKAIKKAQRKASKVTVVVQNGHAVAA